ncbi:LOW QUALITY PROTEIN: putative secreted protein, partial [Streptomyces himastatinicus ATCC 53653]
EVYGDLATARRTAVVVPGSDIDLANFDRTHDRYGTPAGMAKSLRAQLARDAPGTRTAVVAWVGYTTPVGVGPDAATSRLAKAGAPRLDRFLAGLAVTTAGTAEAPPAVFCHSYGSVLCGVARAPRWTAPGCPIWWAFGSPGMGRGRRRGAGHRGPGVGGRGTAPTGYDASPATTSWGWATARTPRPPPSAPASCPPSAPTATPATSPRARTRCATSRGSSSATSGRCAAATPHRRRTAVMTSY